MINIEDKLREHKSNLSKILLLECDMRRIENEIQTLEPSYISAVQYSDMPKSHTNKFSSVVENTVLEIETNQERIQKLKETLWGKVSEREEYRIKVDEVNALLEGLTEEERFIIEKYYFDGLSWPIVAEKYRKEYGMYKTPKTMKEKKREAIEKMRRNVAMIHKSKCPA